MENTSSLVLPESLVKTIATGTLLISLTYKYAKEEFPPGTNDEAIQKLIKDTWFNSGGFSMKMRADKGTPTLSYFLKEKIRNNAISMKKAKEYAIAELKCWKGQDFSNTTVNSMLMPLFHQTNMNCTTKSAPGHSLMKPVSAGKLSLP